MTDPSRPDGRADHDGPERPPARATAPGPLLGGVRMWVVVAVASAGNQLRRWGRQPLLLATAFVLPVVVATLVSLALGGTPSIDATLAVVDLDRGPAGAAFRRDALGDPRVAEVFDVREVAGRDEAQRLVDGGEADAAVILPVGLTEALTSTAAHHAGTRPEVIRSDEASIGADLAAMVVDLYVVRAEATGAAAAVGQPLAPDPALSVEPTAPGGRALDAATHYGPAIGLFFVMVAVGAAVEAQVDDRTRGIAARLATTRAHPAAAAFGRAMAALAFGGASLTVTAVTMQAVFGRSWGPGASVAALVVAVSLAYAGIATLLGRLVRTAAQAQGLSLAVAFVMAVASGSFAPPGAAVSRHRLADLLPATWALDGFALTATERVAPLELWPTLLYLVLSGAAFVAAAGVVRRSAS